MFYTTCFCLALLGSPQGDFMAWVSDRAVVRELPESIGTRLTGYRLLEIANGTPPPPYLTMTTAVRLPDGTLWAGTKKGLMLRLPRQHHWRLFHSRRWLPSNEVLDLAVTERDDVWVKTPRGITRIHRRKANLPEKMEAIHQQLRKWHVRSGLVGEILLKKPGLVDSGWFQPDNDNDGLWTALYVAAESFRFGTTGDPQARENAWKSLQALMFLESITKTPGFVARSVVPISISKKGQRPWVRSDDGKWWWKGDTSSDELDGHFFAYGIYYDLAATEQQKKRIRPVVHRIMNRIVSDGYYYRDHKGRITTWGRWAPELLNRDPEWIAERGLNSLEILSYLKTAYHITGDERFHEAARELIQEHGYALNTVRQKMTSGVDVEENHSDDELAAIAYYPLLRYERDPKLRGIYLLSLQRTWAVERTERGPLFNFIYAACRQASTWQHPDQRPSNRVLEPAQYDRGLCVRWFQEVPVDTIHWTIINRDRWDLGRPFLNRHGQLCSTRVLPIAERRVMRWNGDPYELDGGNGGRTRDDGAFILLPYWMGRYHRLLE